MRSSSSILCPKTLTGVRYPGVEVIITDLGDLASSSGANTPAVDNDGDFFSSWEKPSIKRPSAPPSRSGTPSQTSRTASPFLNAPSTIGNGISRSTSPLINDTTTNPAPVARAIQSSAVRKTPAATSAPRKTNILGAKKTTKLGAKKVATGEDLDFDAVEKRAKEEAERIDKLGYDPDADDSAKPAAPSGSPAIVSPLPVSPSGGFGQTRTAAKGKDDAPGITKGMARLGFGQVGGGKASTPAARSMGGFGSTGRSNVQGKGRSPSVLSSVCQC